MGVMGLSAGLAFSTLAQSPTYVSQSATGAASAVSYLATQPALQIRVVGAIAQSDLATATLAFKAGGTPLTVAYTNAAGTWVGVSRTNGFAAGDSVLIETAAGVITNGVISSFGAATNIVFTTAMCATKPGDQIYKLGTATTLFVGAATNVAFMGEAVFVAPKGRPVMATVTGTADARLAVSARYE
jgi:hypothetical protein